MCMVVSNGLHITIYTPMEKEKTERKKDNGMRTKTETETETTLNSCFLISVDFTLLDESRACSTTQLSSSNSCCLQQSSDL